MDEERDVKGTLFTIIILAGFALIFIFVPRLVHNFGVSHGKNWSNGIGYFAVALAWWIWTEICLLIKNRGKTDE